MQRQGPPERVQSLDGLRGLAASVVVVGHMLNASVVALSLVALGRHAHLTALESALSYTPLHILWSGQDWVIVFFVLSGFVLSLAAADGARFQAGRYYPTRFIRLYVPVWAALIVAATAHQVIAHTATRGATPWLNAHAVSLRASMAAHNVTLVAGAGDGGFTTVLWSLRWEVIFSLLLPAFLLVGARLDRRIVAAGALVLVFAFGHQNAYALYMPPFMLGVVLAYSRSTVRAWLRGRAGLVAGVSLVLLTANWWLSGFAASHLGLMLTDVGASGLVATGMTPGAFTRILETRPLQLLGRRSFSLYLVHEPLVVAAAFALGARPSLAVLALVALPLIVIVTEVFYRTIERPSHVWARRAGDVVTAALRGLTAHGLRTVDDRHAP